MKRLCHFVLAIGLGLALWPSMSTPVRAVELEVGEPFPELWLPALADGAPISTNHWHGKKVILHVFASW